MCSPVGRGEEGFLTQAGREGREAGDSTELGEPSKQVQYKADAVTTFNVLTNAHCADEVHLQPGREESSVGA
jgi:hypothetical protein